MAGVTSIALNDGFSTMDEAIKAVENAMAAQFHPVRRETKETVRNFNKKCTKDERKITTLSEDQQYSQRFATAAMLCCYTE